MMGALDPSPIPPWAIQCWCDATNIYVALPMTAGGTPYITRYPRSEGGLASALAVLMQRQPEAPKPSAAAPANYTQPQVQPAKLSAAQAEIRSLTTEAQRENARRIILQMGLKR